MALEQNRFLQPQLRPAPRRKRWGGCWGGMSFFSKQKRGKRIVPSSRMPEANPLLNQHNGPQPVGLPNQMIGIAASIFAPPSSPASFSNSGIPSTAQSPNCFVSANSPEAPSSTMYMTGPYAHETQPVTPPVFSTFTTEPSTAPVTPPPELAHLTTPSSPDVPYALFLTSSLGMKSTEKGNNYAASDLQAAYPLSPGSPAGGALRSPVVSGASGDCSSTPFNERSRQDTNFFCPETFAQFYEQSSFTNAGGRLSISKDSDAYSNAGNGYQNRQNKVCRPDAEELDAYRASFGFSADEIITTPNYVEISDVLEEGSFSMPPPVLCDKAVREDCMLAGDRGNSGTEKGQEGSSTSPIAKHSYANLEGQGPQKQSGRSLVNDQIQSEGDDDILSKMGTNGRKHEVGASSSDAEIEYRRGRSLRERHSWRGEERRKPSK
ncbi:uncharacterized protein At1g76660-like [Andrographis paniculata]|uniref:uncharacterized protein At1g76660-like n=1 Tax=Andrographis paniculata TaxID=175694 RepID=UPI0021E8E198|nr:uncharacterized protein At1g76660-like [Andrographis paniculata]XP_051118202.1 uncharacterized protein At1g76660-like [Andrographis paniculata]